MESKQGGGEMSEDCIPGSCKYETYTMRTLANKYLCNGCNRFGREVRVICKGDGFLVRNVSVWLERSADD